MTAWKWFVVGVRLKQAAFFTLLTTPVIPVALQTLNVTAAIAAIPLVPFLALILDFAGRCCCLQAPVHRRSSIVASVAFQGAGIASLIVCLLMIGGEIAGIVAGTACAILMQIPAAVCFTQFLQDVVNQLHDDQLGEDVRQLQSSLLKTAGAGLVFGASFTTVAVFCVVIGLFTYGLGFCIAVPAGMVGLIPIAVWALATICVMWIRYNSTLFQATAAVQGRTAVETDPE